MTGTLSSTTFGLADGSIFVADSAAFSASVSDLYTVADPVYDLTRPIVINGTIIPYFDPGTGRDPGTGSDPGTAPVPEPSTLALIGTGMALTSWRARRRRR